jgi:hypothetical protein
MRREERKYVAGEAWAALDHDEDDRGATEDRSTGRAVERAFLYAFVLVEILWVCAICYFVLRWF